VKIFNETVPMHTYSLPPRSPLFFSFGFAGKSVEVETRKKKKKKKKKKNMSDSQNDKKTNPTVHNNEEHFRHTRKLTYYLQ
jgi:hypothetical protein